MDHLVSTLRRFNRSYTQRIGALDDSFLGSGRALGPSRLLFEIGPEGAGVAELRARLGLDSGYLSRLLRQLELDGVVEVVADPLDGRRRNVGLTERGHREWALLDQRSDQLAERLVAPLSARQRAQLGEALDVVDQLIRAATVSFDEVDPLDDDAVWALQQYFAELDERFPHGFDPGNAIAEGAAAMCLPHGSFVVVRADGRPLGCGGVQRIDDTTHEIKRMWVRTEWRGAGIGRRLLEHLEGVCRRLGSRRIVLDTNSVLVEAIAMYERSGYRSIDRYNDNPYALRWFEKRLN